MIKSITDFLVTGIALIFAYIFYFVSVIIVTLLLGFPIAIGIKMILDILPIIFTNTITSTY